MKFLDRFFKRKEAAGATVVNIPSSTFSRFTGSAYENDVFRAAVDAIARNAARLEPMHAVGDKQSADTRLSRLLQVRPNPYMSTYDFLYKLVSQYYLYGNAFALLYYNDAGGLAGIFPLTYTHVDFLADAGDHLFTRFTLKNGSVVLFDYDDIIHLRRHYVKDDLLAENNGALFPVLKLAEVENEGILKGIQNAATIRGILSATSAAPMAKLKQLGDNFKESFLKSDNTNGIAVTDASFNYTPIDSKPIILSADQSAVIRDKIYSYLGISEKIVNASYTEDEFAAFYESVIEPLAVQMSLEFTSKIFTDREQSFGNRILFNGRRMQFASNKSKAEMVNNLLPYSVLTINEARDLLNLPPLADGDKRIQTLNVVNAKQADTYQGGKKNDEGNQTDKRD